MISFLRKLFTRQPASGAAAQPAFDPERFIYVMVPGDIQPLERGERFEDPLEGILETSGLGTISGGGSQLDDPHPDGRARVLYCGMDIEVADRDRARQLLMKELPPLGVPVGTELHYTSGGAMLLDRYGADGWQVGLERKMPHPGFGI